MPDHPILVFPARVVAQRVKLNGGGNALVKPSRAEQGRRLDARFQTLSQSFTGLQRTVDGVDPEQVIVFETAFEDNKTLLRFAEEAGRVPGLEWLSEVDIEDLVIDGFGPNAVPRRLFAVMSNRAAMAELLRLWQRWKQAGRLRTHYGPFTQLFAHLADVRRWDARDRIIDTGLLQWWEDRLNTANAPIRFEAELWYRRTDADRQRAIALLDRIITDAGGRRLQESQIADIAYHGVLLECPPNTIRMTVDRLRQQDYTELLRCEAVMFYRPTAQSLNRLRDEVGQQEAHPATQRPAPQGDPIIGMLDGLPLANHRMLAGRLIIDDPDDFAAAYRTGQQQHGTAMASLIVHDDLYANTDASTRPVYARPVMVPVDLGGGNVREEFPQDQLFVDLFHRAVRRIVEGDGNEGPAAPTVRIVNVSIGNQWQPFIHTMSPLAKLIDWLACKHRLLFVISAGNHGQDIALEALRRDFANLTDDEVVLQGLRAMVRSTADRRLISPAESVNAITAGAVHHDGSPPGVPGQLQDILRGRLLPSLINPVANGLHRAVKPDLLMPGGRQVYSARLLGQDRPATFEISQHVNPPGHKVAAPSPRPGDLSRFVHVRGTSNAAALTSRLAGQVYENLLALRTEPGGHVLTDELLTVLTKALVVHGCRWGEHSSVLQPLCDGGGSWRSERQKKAQLLGYGVADRERSLVASDRRVILIGTSEIADGEGHRFDLPLPTSMSGLAAKRRITATLAWFTPLNQRHRAYRSAGLYLRLDGAPPGFIASSCEADDKLSSRGTVQHLIYEADQVAVIADDDELSITVNCRAVAGRLDEAVPYGLAVTIEVADPIEIDIYTEIRDRVRARAAVRP